MFEIILVILIFLISKFGNIFKIKMLNESLVTVIFGIMMGFLIVKFEGKNLIENLTTGYTKFFLIFLLPPIIFESAYNVDLKIFYKNFGTILVYAVLGTIISIIFISYSLYYFSLHRTFEVIKFFIF
jgi:NhaP-type Na+/H+ or K+/H+ antiporter